jgi:hypothetical protein
MAIRALKRIAGNKKKRDAGVFHNPLVHSMLQLQKITCLLLDLLVYVICNAG